ncbi:MAG: hypothetical protein K8R40_02260 [Anaerolineaceae bacterium]|nr:hypothetical protein [Anaerolineaceae bacterium]
MVAVFKFKVPRKAAKLKVPYRPKDKPLKMDVELPQHIQGNTTFSKPELYVSWALSKLKIKYKFQFSVRGGEAGEGGR